MDTRTTPQVRGGPEEVALAEMLAVSIYRLIGIAGSRGRAGGNATGLVVRAGDDDILASSLLRPNIARCVCCRFQRHWLFH